MQLVESFLTTIEEQQVVAAIRQAEAFTVGEIRVHLEQNNHIPVLERATQVFYEIGMQHTAAQTGVLIYVSVDARKFAIIGDKGIDCKVSDDFWESCNKQLSDYFFRADCGAGLRVVIEKLGKELAIHFPSNPDDTNELSDAISKGL